MKLHLKSLKGEMKSSQSWQFQLRIRGAGRRLFPEGNRGTCGESLLGRHTGGLKDLAVEWMKRIDLQRSGLENALPIFSSRDNAELCL